MIIPNSLGHSGPLSALTALPYSWSPNDFVVNQDVAKEPWCVQTRSHVCAPATSSPFPEPGGLLEGPLPTAKLLEWEGRRSVRQTGIGNEWAPCGLD